MTGDAAGGQPRAPREERKIVSVLFVDLVGFTARSDRADPEDVQDALRPYFQRAKLEIESLGGVVEKFIGDAVVGVFGVPASREDDAERAVRSALLITEGIEELNRSNPGLDLAVRAAVNTGEAVVTLEARPETGEGFVTGDVINTASRLQGVAPEGGVVVGELTHSLTRDVVEYEELEPVQVKGKAHPVPLWRAKRTITEFGGEAPHTGATPLVGRRLELDLLTRLWEQVVDDRRPRLVTLIGSPGIGKSRLTRELGERIQGTGAVLKGRCRPYGETTGYDAFGQQVQQAAGILATDAAAEARTKLNDLVASLVEGDDTEEVAEHLAVLLGQSSERNPDKQLLFYSVRRFVEALARRTPLALAFEDIHWAAPVLLELIESLGARTRDAPLFLVATARPDLLDARPTWGGGLPGYTAVPVEPLSDDDARELAVQVLAESEGTRTAVDRLIETGGGNPLFIEELASSLAQQGAEFAERLPTSVRAIIAARLDALPKEERHLLQDASVIGRVFWRGALAAMTADGTNLDFVLDSLEGRDFVRRQPASRVAGDREFVFKHALTQEVAYGTLPRAARRERHALVAQYLESASGDRAKESASLLAHHWREAGDPARAARFLMMAADVASRAWAKREAIALYDDAITLLADSDDRSLLEEALTGRAATRIEVADFSAALEEDLDRLTASSDQRTRALGFLLRSRSAFWQVDAQGVHRYAPMAVQEAKDLGDVDLEARAIAMVSEATSMDGELERAREIRDKALALWPADTKDGDYAYAMSQAALNHYWQGQYEEALPIAEQGYEAALETSNVTAVINCAAHAGLSLAGLSRHEEGLKWFERAANFIQELEQLQVMTLAGRTTNMWAGTLREIGDLSAAKELNEQALDLGKRASFVGAIVSAQIDLLVHELMLGEIGKAERALKEIMDSAEQTKGWHQWLWLGRLREARALIALAAGRGEEAATAAEEALATAIQNGRLKYTCRSRIDLGRSLLLLGKPDSALQTFRDALGEADLLRHAPSQWSALLGLGDAHTQLGQDEEAADVRARAQQAIDDFAGRLSDQRRATFFSSPQFTEVRP